MPEGGKKIHRSTGTRAGAADRRGSGLDSRRESPHSSRVISEPDVTLTDYGLAIECAAFAYLLSRRGCRGDPLRTSFMLFFASTALAAFTGGAVHGFFPDERTWGSRIL